MFNLEIIISHDGDLFSSSNTYLHISQIYLKVDLDDINNIDICRDENRISNKHTLFNTSRFSHSDCGYPSEKMYANEWAINLLEEK